MDNDEGDPSRREFIGSAIVAGGAAGLGISPLPADDSTQRPMSITLNVNGHDHRLNLDHVLRFSMHCGINSSSSAPRRGVTTVSAGLYCADQRPASLLLPVIRHDAIRRTD